MYVMRRMQALRVIASNLPEIEIHGLREMFVAMDTDKSGTISMEELKEALRLKVGRGRGSRAGRRGSRAGRRQGGRGAKGACMLVCTCAIG